MTYNTTPADAGFRHVAENLLHTYVRLADEKNVPEAARLLADAELDFAGKSVQGEKRIAEHYRALWADTPRGRHLISNLIVHGTGAEGELQGSALYTRWILDGDPHVVTFGEYAFTMREDQGWRITSLRVSRSWEL